MHQSVGSSDGASSSSFGWTMVGLSPMFSITKCIKRLKSGSYVNSFRVGISTSTIENLKIRMRLVDKILNMGATLHRILRLIIEL